MQKRWLQVVGSTMLVVALAACSSNSSSTDSSTSSSSASSGGKTKIVYWTPDRHDAEFMQSKVDEFNKTNKDNIEVDMNVMGDNYPQAVDIAFASKQAPDVLQIDDFETYVKKGYLTPINDYMSDEMKQTFKDVIIDHKNEIDGKIYTLPNTGQTWRLIYNEDLFKQAGISAPPKTLDEMVQDAKKITDMGKAQGIYGFASPLKGVSGFGRPANTVGPAGVTTGVDGYNYVTGEFDFSMYKDIALAMRQMMTDGSMLPGVESLDIDPLRAQFAQGKIGMYFNHSGEPGVYKDQFPTQVKWAAAPPPTKDGKIVGAVQVIGGSYIGISADSPNKDAAWKFMNYVYSTDLQTKYYENGYGVSLIPTVLEHATKPTIPGIAGFLPRKYDALYPANPLSATESQVEGPKWTEDFVKYVLTGGDVDGIINDLNTRYNAALKQARDSGLTTIKADPSFSSAKLEGKLSKDE
ncbi:ABC transporter substrate-binding protein [Paenibacillus hunanensis]|uniref:Multiple sugar transport system substrate-binding protein n=1 Tax=Paenibacillus hunanensis TaxID=539262 RepID=A0ABU1J1N0_9BACL|nr:extracellular solute-binding protein [Paenibacillus hunanensis]MDR6245415.1 multiple sugar transport system substrate-binding protein [Paenibacillus hunanensis]